MLMMLVAMLGAVGGAVGTAAPNSGQWDAGLQGGPWRLRQQAVLAHGPPASQQTTRRRARAATSLLDGTSLEPCAVPAATPPLPSVLPLEIAELISNATSELDAMFAQSKATGGSAALVYGDRVIFASWFRDWPMDWPRHRNTLCPLQLNNLQRWKGWRSRLTTVGQWPGALHARLGHQNRGQRVCTGVSAGGPGG